MDNKDSHTMNPRNVSHTEAKKVDARKKEGDVTGQTDTTLNEMKSRLKEVPHTSAATEHDTVQYSKDKKQKGKAKK